MPDIPLILPGNQGFLPKNFHYTHEWTNGMPALEGTPAVSSWLDLSGTYSYEVRAIREVRGILYALIEDKLYKITASDTYSIVGTVSNPTGDAVMVDNGTEIMVCQLGVNSYNYTIATETLTLLTVLPAFSSLTYQDGWAIGSSIDTELFYINETAYSFATWGALDYEYADRLPDLLTAGHVLDGELWLFGTKSIEVYQNTGNASFPWEKIQGVDHTIGTDARLCVALLDNSLFFKDNHNQVRRTAGYQTTIISTEQIERAIADIETVSDARGFDIHYKGSWWYVLTFPSGNKTFIYDITASAKLQGHVWYQWTSFPDQGRHRINCHTVFNRDNLIGDHSQAIIWKLDSSVYHDNGEEIHSEYTFPKIPDGGTRMTGANFELDMKMGVGLINDLAAPASGSDPQVMISYSDDGGQSFKSERFSSMGKMGEATHRIKRFSMGMTRRHGRIMRVKITDPVERVIQSARFNT